MKIIKDVAGGLRGMFLADARLAIATLALVAFVAALVLVLQVEPLVGGGILLFGSCVILVEGAVREAKRRNVILFARRSVGAARIFGAGGLIFVLTVGVYLAALQLTGNFHPVVKGEVYRSAQPRAHDIAKYRKRYGIKTIVNLRGNNAGVAWYEAEVNEAKRLGVIHVDFRMSASHELTQAQAANLVDILEHAEKPLLIHCQAGADRSGLASALYVAAVAKLGEDAAERQISIRYGHISLPLSSAYAMDRAFESLEPWLGFPDS